MQNSKSLKLSCPEVYANTPPPSPPEHIKTLVLELSCMCHLQHKLYNALKI